MNNPALKKLLIAVVAVGVLYVVGAHFNLLPSAVVQKAVAPEQFALTAPDVAPPATSGDVQAVPMPSTSPSSVRSPEIRVRVIPWNAEMGHHFAVGGPVTMKGSLMEKYGVRVSVTNQPDDMKALDDLVKMASEMASGNDEPTSGAHFVIDMGDAMAQYLAAGNKALAKLGPDYRLEIIGAVGYSRGEDKCMGQPEWKDNPESMKGAVIAAQLRQGDWNLCQFFIAQNNSPGHELKSNPDETTWDADAVNWYSTDDFVKAGAAYIGKACIDFDEVSNGRRTGKKVNKCVNGVATWTPGDVEIARKRGGLVSLLSTKENAYQMPATVIGIHKWNVAHGKLVKSYLKAALEGGEQVRHFDEALQRAGKASYAIYKDQNPAYWVKYYRGETVTDKITQQPLELGGSTVMTLDDNLCLFGLAEGCGTLKTSVYNADYTGFGKYVQKQYPRLLPSFPPIEEAVNTTFLAALDAERPKKEDQTDLVRFESGHINKADVVTKKDWNIQFETGKDALSPAAEDALTELYNALLVGGALSIEIDGHTDNTGSPDANLFLSKRRAERVQTWLQAKAPKFFEKNRVEVRGYGDSMPKVPNTTAGNMAINRRVTIILGNKS